MRAILIAVLAALSASFLGACSTTPTSEQKPANVESRQTGTIEQPSSSGVQTSQPSVNPLKDPNNILSKRSVYYDFDKFDIKDQYRPIVEAHAKYLQSHPDAKMLIQGNCDERGSREYNVALGQRRAEGVKKMLTLLGAKDTQIEAVSLGEEKPRAQGHDEAAWAENRRSDMLYQGEY